MASRKITDLTALTAPASDDVLPIIDVSEAIASDRNKKITIPNLTSQLSAATTSAAGIVQLNSTTTSTSTTQAATASAAKSAYDVASNAIGRNRLINGGMAIDQRNAGASQTITAAAALAYTVDRWYAYCTGANVTGQRVAGTGSDQYRYQFTGAASVTAIGFGQRIEQLNCYDLNGTTATLSVDLANSLLTSVTWTAYYATTADTFGTLASPTRTQIATGTFTVTSTLTRYNTQISIPAAATTGIEIVFTVGAQTSGTWTVGNVQLEAGSVATPFERRSGQMLALCQRYYETQNPTSIVMWPAVGGTTNSRRAWVPFLVQKRAAPTITLTTDQTITSGNASSYATGFRYGGSQGSGLEVAITDWTATIEL